MTTAREIVSDALRELGVLAAADTASAEDASFGLRKLNQMVQRWSNTRLMVPTLTEINVPLTGAASYTIGPTGDVVAARPIRVNGASATLAGVEYHVRVLNRDQWGDIAFKAVDGGPPDSVWYEATNTNGTIYVYPRSDTYTLVLECQTLLASFALGTTVTLPEGYESALILTLAEDMAGVYGRPVGQDLKGRARGARLAVKRTNTEPLLCSLGLVGSEDYRIERGY
jgi:hypothetical protein